MKILYQYIGQECTCTYLIYSDLLLKLNANRAQLVTEIKNVGHIFDCQRRFLRSCNMTWLYLKLSLVGEFNS